MVRQSRKPPLPPWWQSRFAKPEREGCRHSPLATNEGADDGQEYPGCIPRRQVAPKFLRIRREDHTADAAGPCPFYPHNRVTAEVLRTYRFRCDAGRCTVSDLSGTSEAPTGWTTIDSIAHQLHTPLPSAKAGRARLSALDVRSLRSRGRFWLHLCPTHVGVLDDHTPQTDNEGGQGAAIACSCGARLAWSTPDPKALWLQHYADVSGQQEGER